MSDDNKTPFEEQRPRTRKLHEETTLDSILPGKKPNLLSGFKLPPAGTTAAPRSPSLFEAEEERRAPQPASEDVAVPAVAKAKARHPAKGRPDLSAAEIRQILVELVDIERKFGEETRTQKSIAERHGVSATAVWRIRKLHPSLVKRLRLAQMTIPKGFVERQAELGFKVEHLERALAMIPVEGSEAPVPEAAAAAIEAEAQAPVQVDPVDAPDATEVEPASVAVAQPAPSPSKARRTRKAPAPAPKSEADAASGAEPAGTFASAGDAPTPQPASDPGPEVAVPAVADGTPVEPTSPAPVREEVPSDAPSAALALPTTPERRPARRAAPRKVMPKSRDFHGLDVPEANVATAESIVEKASKDAAEGAFDGSFRKFVGRNHWKAVLYGRAHEARTKEIGGIDLADPAPAAVEPVAERSAEAPSSDLRGTLVLLFSTGSARVDLVDAYRSDVRETAHRVLANSDGAVAADLRDVSSDMRAEVSAIVEEVVVAISGRLLVILDRRPAALFPDHGPSFDAFMAGIGLVAGAAGSDATQEASRAAALVPEAVAPTPAVAAPARKRGLLARLFRRR